MTVFATIRQAITEQPAEVRQGVELLFQWGEISRRPEQSDFVAFAGRVELLGDDLEHETGSPYASKARLSRRARTSVSSFVPNFLSSWDCRAKLTN